MIIAPKGKADVTKKIYFEPAGRIHSSQWNLINYPPEGYEFMASRTPDHIVSSDFMLQNVPKVLTSLCIPPNLAKAFLDDHFKRIPDNTDLIFTYNRLSFREIPWVIQVEWVCTPLGYDIKLLRRYRGVLERLFASDCCKGILTWGEPAKRSILLNLNCAEFEHKIRVIFQTVLKKDLTKISNSDDEKVRLLFVGSASRFQYFEQKGGRLVLEAFSFLSRKYDDLELVIRARVPQHIKDEFGIHGNPKIKLIEEELPWESLEREFASADIFLYPTYELQNTVILDAMSYELPVVTTDFGSNGWIDHGVTGLVVETGEGVPYFRENLIPTAITPQRRLVTEAVQRPAPRLVERVAEKVSILIENPDLRRRMGETARQEVEEGKFSITERNEKLKRIFDEATSGTLRR
jgi:glycosyltransferase involved in cell wall biosynthesis